MLTDDELLNTILEWMDRPSLMEPNANALELLDMIREAERGRGVQQHPDVDTRNTISTPYADKVLEVARDVLKSGLFVRIEQKVTLSGMMELATECAEQLITAANAAAIQNAMKREGES